MAAAKRSLDTRETVWSQFPEPEPRFAGNGEQTAYPGVKRVGVCVLRVGRARLTPGCRPAYGW